MAIKSGSLLVGIPVLISTKSNKATCLLLLLVVVAPPPRLVLRANRTMAIEKKSDEVESTKIDDVAVESDVLEINQAEEKKLLRKIDWKLMPVVSLL